MHKYKYTAKGLAALGRGPDTMLVHMAPGEVAGLQALALSTGGSLTINPHTGLVEAGWLSSILPLVAGAAATYFTGGLASPWVAAALGAGAGGIGAKVEGEDPLTGALFGALGGWGGAGLSSSIMKAGGAGAIPSGTGTVLQNAPTAATAAPVAPVAPAVPAPVPPPAAVQPFAGSPTINAIDNAQKFALPATSPSKEEAFKAGIKSLVDKGGATPQSIWGPMTSMQKLGTGAAAMGMADAASTSSSGGSGKKSNPYYYMTSAETDPNGYVSFGPGKWSKNYDYETLGTYYPNKDTKYAIKKAEGGEVDQPRFVMPPPPPVADPNPNQQYMANLQQLLRQPPPQPTKPYQQEAPPASFDALAAAPASTGKSKKKGFSGFLNAAMNRQPPQVHYKYDPVNGFTRVAARGGIMGLPEASGLNLLSRFIRGPGDGVSDSIPAQIDNQQPAALSNNEFVVDAMTMAKLGNGSPEAGAQKMYAWQQKVHSLPTEPGKDLKADRYLPTRYT